MVQKEPCLDACSNNSNLSRDHDVRSPPSSIVDFPPNIPEDEPKPAIIVGYWLPEKKLNLIENKLFLASCKERYGMVFKKLNLETDLESHLPFHVFFHKITTLYKSKCQTNATRQLMSMDGQISGDEVSEYDVLYSFIKRHPEMPIIDPVKPQIELFDRRVVCNIIQQALPENVPSLAIPTWAILEGASDFHKVGTNLRFPLICKAISTWTCSSHEMIIVFKESQLQSNLIQYPVIIQNYVDHNAVLFKVLVVGDKTTVHSRPSIDIKKDEPNGSDVLSFNGHRLSKPAFVSAHQQDQLRLAQSSVLDEGLVHQVVNNIRSITKLSIFGVDFLVEHQSKVHYVVDINPFPGCSSISQFQQALVDIIISKITPPEHTSNGSLLCESSGKPLPPPLTES